ncbi:S26 family signal peptidase [Subtercola vilae]|uniref:S26 family signal peptidase n=1 Tax=Subtercola vilae TaxID=2056433 RepID=A0A4T2BGW0_9MICO|nr:S26 family signal peptidase [Subtercola vilae]TIH30477.1 S26 family signal peptidase [Subtercola vilae]
MSRPGRIVVTGAATLIAALLIGMVVFFFTGGRWFIVQTPSMGQTAPVGTLILTTPAPAVGVAVGDIITFRPPTSPTEIYTHRVISITDGNIKTQGDINGAVDPWVLHPGDIIGIAAVVLPTIGWAVRALPILAIGTVLVWLISGLFRSATSRSALRVAGVSLVAATAAYILRPLIGIVLLSTNADTTGAHATVVSTGILPIRVQAAGGNHADLVTGQVGTLDVPTLIQNSQYHLSSALNLSLPGWMILGIVCVLPLLWCLIIGLPSDPDRPSP